MDEEAFTRLLDNYTPLLSRVAASYEANLALQQELLQEICLAIWQAMSRFKGQSSQKTYILRVAHNRAISHVNKAVKQPLTDDINEIELADTHAQQLDASLSEQQQLAHLLEQVRSLPLQSRQVLTLSLEDLSYQEIAMVTGLTTSNVGVLLNRAKQTLAEAMHNDG